ncbi:MAG: 50S ribosomal protein L28 [Rickettsiaceae bacterium]|jgi:large subunit ribosomal protein L28|nr:50S ribosomal protein L28 [Rickettsiaceae bacterium]
MSRVCELTGKTVAFGHNVSHSQRKTNRKFCPNLQKKKLFSNILNFGISFRMATATIKTVDKYGGLDAFIQNADSSNFSPKAKNLRKKLFEKLLLNTQEKNNSTQQ